MNLSFNEMYQASLRKDSTFEGSFVMAVKTTGIFCKPTCTARKPYPENVAFYPTPKEAIRHGFRPCKVCKPMEPTGTTPAAIQEMVAALQADPALKIRDEQLRQRGLDPGQVRRWFKKNHQMTFQAYQRMMRINMAYQKIIQGETVTSAAFDSGYDSLSGFGESFRSVFEAAPSQPTDKSVIHITRLTTPIGPMFACATEQGICLLEFTDRRMLETEFQDLKKRLNAVILPGDHPHLQYLARELDAYFEGNIQTFTVPLHTPTTPFRQQVWDLLLQIPYSQTRSYKRQAELLGKPTAVRAVASANGQNRIAIVIPCHRVIGDNGHLTGYSGGLARKQWLLDHERAHLPK